MSQVTQEMFLGRNLMTPMTIIFRVQIEIIDKDGKVNIVRGKIGDNLLYLAKRFEVEMEGIFVP